MIEKIKRSIMDRISVWADLCLGISFLGQAAIRRLVNFKAQVSINFAVRSDQQRNE